MEDYVKETLIASPYPLWLTVLIFALVTGLVQYLVFYFKEKGKNLATKEDIDKITDKVEAVKENYNKALEIHKVELQKDFEGTKYIIGLCNEIDKGLIQCLIKCNSDIRMEIDAYRDEDQEISVNVKSIRTLGEYLNNYGIRYNDIESAKELIKLTNKLDKFLNFSFENEQFEEPHYIKLITQISTNTTSLLNIFLPKFKVKQ